MKPKTPKPQVPIYNLEAERSLIGVVLVDDSTWTVVRHVQPEDFGSPRHRLVWEVFGVLAERGAPLDFAGVVCELAERGRLAEAPLSYLIDCSVAGVSGAYAESYARTVIERSVAAQADHQARELQALLRTGDYRAAIEQAPARFAELAQRAAPPYLGLTIRDAIRSHLERREAREDGTAPRPWSTGFAGLDLTLGGWRQGDGEPVQDGGLRPGELVFVLGCTKMGKSSFARELLLSACAQGARAIYFPTEMGQAQVTDSLIAQRARAPLSVVEGGPSFQVSEALAAKEGERVFDAQMWLASLRSSLILSAEASPTHEVLLQRAERAHRAEGLDILVLDHLQRTRPTRAEEKWSKTEQLYSVVQRLQEWADKHRILVVIAAQAKSDAAREQRVPRREEISWCPTAAQEAQVILAVHRPAECRVDGADPNEAQLHVLASRRSATGQALAFWDGPSVSLRDPGDWLPVRREPAEVISFDAKKKSRGGWGRTKASGWQ